MSSYSSKQVTASPLHVGYSVLNQDVQVLTFQLRPKHCPMSSSLMMKEGDKETSEMLTLQLEDSGIKKQPDQRLRK